MFKWFRKKILESFIKDILDDYPDAVEKAKKVKNVLQKIKEKIREMVA